TSEAVSLHLRLVPETRGFLDADRIGLMAPGSLLVNTARAGLTDSAALRDAVAAGRLGGLPVDGVDAEAPAPPRPPSPHPPRGPRDAAQGVDDPAGDRPGCRRGRGVRRRRGNRAGPAGGVRPEWTHRPCSSATTTSGARRWPPSPVPCRPAGTASSADGHSRR